MQYMKANETGFDPRPQISRVFVEGFYQWLRYFSKDKEKMSRALAHMFDLGAFYVTLDGDTVIAITACTDGKTPPIHLDKRELRRCLGTIAGFFAYKMLKKNLEEHPYPFEIAPDTGSIEFVVTTPDYRGRGLAAALISHITDNTPYENYVLEVADTNETAMRLYRRLGFAEFMRIKSPAPKRSGVNELVYMKKEKKHL